MAGAIGGLPIWGVINSEPLDIDYEVIYKGFTNAMQGNAEAAIINIVLAAFICWGVWLLVRWFFRRDNQRKVQNWKQVETLKPDYQYEVAGKRQWMRIEANTTFSFWVYDRQGKLDTDREIIEQLLDLSAGGMSFYTDEILNIDNRLHIQLNLGRQSLKLTGRVARVQFSPEEVEKRYMIGVQFIGIRPGEQDLIVKYGLSRQRSIIEEKKKQEELCPTCGQLLPFDENGVIQPCPRCPAPEDEVAAAGDGEMNQQ